MAFKKNIYSSILSVIILCMVTLSALRAQAQVTEKASAKAFVQNFYDWYVPLYNTGKPATDRIALKQKAAYFDAPLIAAINKDYNEQPANADDVLGLDGDPFLNAQDDGFDYQAGNVRQVGNKFQVDIHAALFGKSKKQTLAADIITIAEVAKINGQWKFTNFLYTAKDGGGSLLSVLASLRKERNEWLVKHHQKPHTN